MKKCISILAFFIVIFFSCGRNDSKIEYEHFLNSRISFPFRKMYNEKQMCEFKNNVWLVSIYDEYDCQDCVMKKIGLESIEMISRSYSVDFIYIFREKNAVKIYNRVIDAGVNGAIFVDTCNAFMKANPKFPSNKLFHTFVVNNEGKVLMVGNPFQNEKMETLFKKVIAREKKRKSNTSCKL